LNLRGSYVSSATSTTVWEILPGPESLLLENKLHLAQAAEALATRHVDHFGLSIDRPLNKFDNLSVVG
jgi:hypothetical protein